MIPLHYVDFQIAPPGREPDAPPARQYERVQGPGTSLPAPVVAGAALKVLHGVFGRQPGRYALALPKHQTAPFAALRVFAESRDDLDELVQAVEGHPVIRDYTRLGYPRKVAKDWDGPWVEFRRYRIPSRKAGRKPGDTLRERRMAYVEENRLPYFILQSRSNGQQFGLYLQALATGPSPEAQPDSYGLSVSSRPFALPDLP